MFKSEIIVSARICYKWSKFQKCFKNFRKGR